MPRGAAAADSQNPTLGQEQLERLDAFVQGALQVKDEPSLVQLLDLFDPSFLLLGADSPDGKRLQGGLRVLAYNLGDFPMSDAILGKAKRLFVGNASLLPDYIKEWQRQKDAAGAVEPAAAAAAANTPKPTKVEATLAAASAAGFLAPGFTEGKLKEVAKRLESTGAPSFSQRSVLRWASGNWVSEAKTPGLPGAKEHGFLRAAWRDARQEFPLLEPASVLLLAWPATKHFMLEVCRDDLEHELSHILWMAETKLMHPLVVLGLKPDRIIDLVEKHCFEAMSVVLAQHKDALASDEELGTFEEIVDINPAILDAEVARQARETRHVGDNSTTHHDADFAISSAASGLLLPYSISPATASILRQDGICPLDLIAADLCPMGFGCTLGHFQSAADREAAASDPRYG